MFVSPKIITFCLDMTYRDWKGSFVWFTLNIYMFTRGAMRGRGGVRKGVNVYTPTLPEHVSKYWGNWEWNVGRKHIDIDMFCSMEIVHRSGLQCSSWKTYCCMSGRRGLYTVASIDKSLTSLNARLVYELQSELLANSCGYYHKITMVARASSS